ncbi:MAG: nucleotidyl transferase AbiEii/AbiGii toxin family protein [Gammaproteobacteria bacterium]
MERYNQNLALLEVVAQSLEELLSEVTFVGGCTTILLVDTAAFGGVRQTDDVDVIVDIATRLEYEHLSQKLRSKGFTESRDGPTCRWVIKDRDIQIKLDVMPNSETILGYTNRWYVHAMENADTHILPSELEIAVVSPGYFLATKFEAFLGRGNGDYAGSHDLEDIVFVLENRSDLMRELVGYPDDVKQYLGTQARAILNDDFLNVLPGLTTPGGESAVEGYLRILSRW